ncbi:MAG TPA: hypothetical protein VGF64_14680 [Acidimicrobiales bacterium]
MSSLQPVIARKTWRSVEPVHAMIYFAPEAAERYVALGLDGQMGYFASRSAPMGPVGVEVVIATFFNFNPDLVGSAIPVAWEKATCGEILEARLAGADMALRRVLGDAAGSPEMARAAELARIAAEAASERPEGRPLFAGHSKLPWPSEPHLVLWQAQALLREYRGDGHVAILTGAGLTGIEALVLHAATGEVPAEALRVTRSWSHEQWNEGVEAVRSRGWLSAGEELSLSEAGRAHRQQVEDATDHLALHPYAALGDERCSELRALARPFSRTIVSAGMLFGAPRSG